MKEIILILAIISCGILLNSRNKTIKRIGMALAIVGTIGCIYIGYELGGLIGAFFGVLIMLFIIGTGVNEDNKIKANEYLANKGREREEGKR